MQLEQERFAELEEDEGCEIGQEHAWEHFRFEGKELGFSAQSTDPFPETIAKVSQKRADRQQASSEGVIGLGPLQQRRQIVGGIGMRERLPESNQPVGGGLDAGLQTFRGLRQQSQQITFRERVQSQPLSEQRPPPEGRLTLPVFQTT
ncbi:hypothetical protein JIX56_21855 [Streptomyces sp. CA-210063]|uniref:hypothetical protein n=1 Tax=Streptomyces sp. CA-210063 TaxID=2801029 RepID=UPI00214BAD91|nr:hypothetical protein [Streptomyces sp. CA-210063]UUU37439.1 hypothetical protein JIX56_21855 [Streptomyces sp. CA-210063]